MPTTSILDTTKQLLGISLDQTEFDAEIIVHINSIFMILRQLGVGPQSGFVIQDNTALWQSFTSDIVMVAAAKTYLAARVRLLFDPPQTSFGIAALERTIEEFEWRLNVVAESITPPSDPTAN